MEVAISPSPYGIIVRMEVAIHSPTSVNAYMNDLVEWAEMGWNGTEMKKHQKYGS